MLSLLLFLLLSSLLLLLLQCAYLYIYLFTEACLEHSQIFGWRISKIVNGLWLLAIFAKALFGMVDWVLNVFEIISFILFINYSLITLSIYSFTFVFINLCVCFKSVYIEGLLLLFSCFSMFYHFCLRNLYMKTFVSTFFNLLIKL